MAAPTCTLGGLNINDGTKYFIPEGTNLGEKVKTWSEYRGYGGTVAQTNVTEAALIECHIPLLIKGTSLADLRTNIIAVNTKLDLATNTLVWDGTSFYCVDSPRITLIDDNRARIAFWTTVDLVLYRTP